MQSATAEQQRILWKDIAAMRRKNDEFIMAWFASVGERLIAHASVADGMRVLDVATGTGEPGLTIAQRFPSAKVIGFDNSEDMAAIAKEKTVQKEVQNFQVLVGDASVLPFEDSSFDAIVCRHGVMFFPDITVCLDEFRRVIRPGSKIALSAWGPEGKNPWAQVFTDVFRRYAEVIPEGPDRVGRFRCAQAGLLKQFLENTGCANTGQEEVEGVLEFNSSEDAWERLTRISVNHLQMFERLPHEIQPKAKKEILKGMEAYARHGTIQFPWSSWVAWGRK
jgi:ubiquinone/menaquinone biosynthesis C-methylase UbiE